MPPEPPLWAVDDPLWALASLIILFASILFLGSLVGNPALPVRGPAFAAQSPPRGVFAIPRHPMMWVLPRCALPLPPVTPPPAWLILSPPIGALAPTAHAGTVAQQGR